MLAAGSGAESAVVAAAASEVPSPSCCCCGADVSASGAGASPAAGRFPEPLFVRLVFLLPPPGGEDEPGFPSYGTKARHIIL